MLHDLPRVVVAAVISRGGKPPERQAEACAHLHGGPVRPLPSEPVGAVLSGEVAVHTNRPRGVLDDPQLGQPSEVVLWRKGSRTRGSENERYVERGRAPGRCGWGGVKWRGDVGKCFSHCSLFVEGREGWEWEVAFRC